VTEIGKILDGREEKKGRKRHGWFRAAEARLVGGDGGAAAWEAMAARSCITIIVVLCFSDTSTKVNKERDDKENERWVGPIENNGYMPRQVHVVGWWLMGSIFQII
jgi:hypothetical protein